MRLKACPFCGGPAKPVKGMGSGYWVDCETGCNHDVYNTEDEAARAWNQRKRAKKAEPTPE